MAIFSACSCVTGPTGGVGVGVGVGIGVGVGVGSGIGVGVGVGTGVTGEFGRTTGEMAVKILKGEADISTMAIEYYPNPVKKYNPEMASLYNVTIPSDYEAIG